MGDYIKTFVLVVIFLFLAFFNILNVIRHYKENADERQKKKEEKRKAKEEKRRKRKARLFGVMQNQREASNVSYPDNDQFDVDVETSEEYIDKEDFDIDEDMDPAEDYTSDDDIAPIE